MKHMTSTWHRAALPAPVLALRTSRYVSVRASLVPCPASKLRPCANHGFLLIELLIAVPIFMLVIAGIITFMINLYGQLIIKDSRVTMAQQSQSAFNSIRNDLFFARNFADRPNNVMVDVNGPQGTAQSWYFNTSPATLVVYQVALNSSYQSGARQVVYQNTPASGNSCSPNMIELNPPVLNNLIYYIDSSNNLRRRVLVPDPVNPRCTAPFMAETCPAISTRLQQDTSTSSSTVYCPADITLAEGVTSFAIDYFDSNGNLIDMNSGGSPLQAEKITLKLTLSRTIVGDTYTYATELNVKKMNKGDPNIQ